MNFIDYLFEQSSVRTGKFILNQRDGIAFWELHKEVMKFANYLRNHHGTDKIILLASENNYFFLIAYLSIIKSGNICVPVDPTLEQHKYDFIKKKTNANLSFFSRRVKSRIKPGMGCITESLLFSILRTHPFRLYEEPEFDSNRTAEIIFTSGSSAEPKGVMLSHQNIISNTESIISYLGLSDKDTMMVVLPFSYCYGLSLLHTHLRVAGALVLNNSFIFMGSTINDLNKYQCTGFAGVPSHYQILLRKTDLFRKSSFTHLRYFTQAGGKLHNSFITEIRAAFPHIPFYVMYGQTEATARLSYLPPELIETKPGSIGKGIPGVELKVINEKGQVVHPGESGEIYARGANVMSGYYNDPDETARTIVDGWLHTGDLATVDEDGFIYIVARKKEMIKVGGKRVSPKEVEDVIFRIPGVMDCTVEGVDDEILGEALKATVVLNEAGKQLREDEIRQYCGEHLETFKVPTYIIIKDQMELSSSGKKVAKPHN
jgi:acyl-CoA synthetase (AMP-forming)/AMP-acid ligase II